MSGAAVFELRDGRFVASELARGPWDSGAQHGGAPAALLMRELERAPAAPGLRIARVTYEFLRPVPIGPLSVRVEVVRTGRRVQLLEASVHSEEGVEVLRARALQVQPAAAHEVEEVDPPPAGPAASRPSDLVAPFHPMFSPDAMEIRFAEGTFHGRGPAAAWFCLRAPLVHDEAPSPLQRLAAAADFGNGISSTLPWGDYLFINPDLTLYIEREPRGEWIGLRSRTLLPPDGIGVSESVLYDERGRVGRALQALLVAPR